MNPSRWFLSFRISLFHRLLRIYGMADVTQETEIAPIVLPQTLPDDGTFQHSRKGCSSVDLRMTGRPELGHLARWHVSSHKYGFGVDNLRDNDENTFWQ